MRITPPRIYLLTAAAAVLAGCGSDGLPGGAQAPTAGALVADSMEALERLDKPAVRFDLRARAKPRLSGPAALLVGDRVTLEIEGAASSPGLTASGKVEAGNESFEGEIRAGHDGFYLRVNERWYGTPESSPGGGFAVKSPPRVERARLAAALRQAGDALVDGEVDAGPEVGGVETWQVEGTLHPDTVVEIGRRIGMPLSPEEETSLREQADQVHIEYAAGREDGLPRRIALRGAITKADLPAELAGDIPLEKLELDLEIELRDWGTPVRVEAPEEYTSFEELIGSFFTGSGIGLQLPEGAPPAGPPPELPTPEIPEIPPPPAVPPHEVVPPAATPPAVPVSPPAPPPS